jgi:hypothetical protein
MLTFSRHDFSSSVKESGGTFQWLNMEGKIFDRNIALRCLLSASRRYSSLNMLRTFRSSCEYCGALRDIGGREVGARTMLQRSDRIGITPRVGHVFDALIPRVPFVTQSSHILYSFTHGRKS